MGHQIDLCLFQSELCSKTIAVGHNGIQGNAEYRGDFFVTFSSFYEACHLDFHRADVDVLQGQISRKRRTDSRQISFDDFYASLVFFTDMAFFQLLQGRGESIC